VTISTDADVMGTVKPDAKQKHQLIWLPCRRCHRPRWARLVSGRPRAQVCAECARHFAGLACANCHRRWRGLSSPGYCPACGQLSYPVILNIPYQKDWYEEEKGNNH